MVSKADGNSLDICKTREFPLIHSLPHSLLNMSKRALEPNEEPEEEEGSDVRLLGLARSVKARLEQQGQKQPNPVYWLDLRDLPREILVENLLGRLTIRDLVESAVAHVRGPSNALTPPGYALVQLAWYAFAWRDYRRPYAPHHPYAWVKYFERMLRQYPRFAWPPGQYETYEEGLWSLFQRAAEQWMQGNYQSRYDAARGNAAARQAIINEAEASDPVIKLAGRFRRAWRRAYAICTKITRLLVTWAWYETRERLTPTIEMPPSFGPSLVQRLGRAIVSKTPMERRDYSEGDRSIAGSASTSVATHSNNDEDDAEGQAWFTGRRYVGVRPALNHRPDIVDAAAAVVTLVHIRHGHIGSEVQVRTDPEAQPLVSLRDDLTGELFAVQAQGRPGDLVLVGSTPPQLLMTFAFEEEVNPQITLGFEDESLSMIRTAGLNWRQPGIRWRHFDLEAYIHAVLRQPATRKTAFEYVFETFPTVLDWKGRDRTLPHRRALLTELGNEMGMQDDEVNITRFEQERPRLPYPLIHALYFALSPTYEAYERSLPGTHMMDFLDEEKMGGYLETPLVKFAATMNQ
jgi:hypothetical protein